LSKKNLHSLKTSARVNGETKILDLLMAFPDAADIFAAYNLHCFSCPFGAGESIEDGCAAHGFSTELTAELIDDLQKAFPSPAQSVRRRKNGSKSSKNRKRKSM